MASVAVLFVLLCQSANALRAGSVAKSTPVTKVVELLERLSRQVASEGAKEAAEYDKFACFCKEQADDKLYAIEKSTDKIEALDASIKELKAEIIILNADIKTLGDRIIAIDKEVTTDIKARNKSHDIWAKADSNMAEASEATREAMKVLRDSKKDMDGAKLDGGDLLQLPGKASRAIVALLGLASVQGGTSPARLQTLTALVQATQQPGQPAKYQYHSNDIIDLLAKLLVDFKKNRDELFDTEYKEKVAHDSKILDLENEKQFKSESKARKVVIEAKKAQDQIDDEAEKLAEDTDKKADEAFQKELTTQCQDKAVEFSQRSDMRAAEITMLHDAATKLKEGVETNYGANGKLVGLVKVGASVSFLQQGSRNSEKDAQNEVVHKVVQLLDQQAGILKSPFLAAIAAKAEMQGGGHFDKVKGLITDLITKLEDDAKAEKDHKTLCDTEMTKAVGDRDGEQLNAETHAATIAENQAKTKQLEGEIAELSEEVSDLTKSLTEQTELRADEKAANELTIADATAGKAAVGEAITLLKDFYVFVQYKAVKQGPDRDGDTVKDLAPTLTYKGDYKGKTTASKGVIGLLEIIEADFDRTISTAGTDESGAVTDFDTFKKATDGSIDTKGKSKKTKEAAVGTAEGAIVSAKSDMKDADDLHAASLTELEKLRAMCVEGEESFAEKDKARKAEIAALKKAIVILDGWKVHDATAGR